MGIQTVRFYGYGEDERLLKGLITDEYGQFYGQYTGFKQNFPYKIQNTVVFFVSFGFELYADLLIVPTIVHCDGTPIPSFHIGDQREADWLLRAQWGTTAQRKRFAGDYSHDDFWNRETILEVVPTYLKRHRLGKC